MTYFIVAVKACGRDNQCITKSAAQVRQHRDGQKCAIAKKHNLIVSLLRAAVKTAAVTLGIYLLAAVAALNVPALVGGVLALNALLGMYFRLEGTRHESAVRQSRELREVPVS